MAVKTKKTEKVNKLQERMNRSIEGLDSQDLETRIKSTVFILNEIVRDITNYKVLNELRDELKQNLLSAPLSLHFWILDSYKDNYVLKRSELFSYIAREGNEEIALNAVDMIAVTSTDIADDALQLAHIIDYTENAVVKEKARNALSSSLGLYLKIIKLNSHSPNRFNYMHVLVKVAGLGNKAAAATAYNAIVDCKETCLKLPQLEELSNTTVYPSCAEKAGKELSNSFEEITALGYNKNFELKISCFNTLIHYFINHGNEKLALKCLEEATKPLRDETLLKYPEIEPIDQMSLELIKLRKERIISLLNDYAEYFDPATHFNVFKKRSAVISDKAKEYLARHEFVEVKLSEKIKAMYVPMSN